MTIGEVVTLGQHYRSLGRRVPEINVPAAFEIETSRDARIRPCVIVVGVEEPRYGLRSLVAVTALGPNSQLIEVHIGGKIPCYSWCIDSNAHRLEVRGSLEPPNREVEKALIHLLMAKAAADTKRDLQKILQQRAQGGDTSDWGLLTSFLETDHMFSPEVLAHLNLATINV